MRCCSYIQASAINSAHASCQEQPSSIQRRALHVCSGGMCFLSGSSPQRPAVVAGTVRGGFGMRCNQIRCGGVNAESPTPPSRLLRWFPSSQTFFRFLNFIFGQLQSHLVPRSFRCVPADAFKKCSKCSIYGLKSVTVSMCLRSQIRLELVLVLLDHMEEG